MTHQPTLLELTEYEPHVLPRDRFTQDLARSLWQSHGAQVSIEEPSFKNENRWVLTSQGWVGYIPLSPELHLALRPKVPLDNLFRMLEYAYKVGVFLKDDIVHVESLEDLYESLALVLAQRVLERARRGLYRTYIPLEEHTPYVRGRVDLRHASQAPWDPRIRCHFQEHTADIEENQILAWTLYAVPRTPLLTDRARPQVLQAYRQVRPFVALEPVDPSQCLRRLYHRLNEDYEPMHALCHFFLENVGPSYRSGERNMVPFLIGMAHLYEEFVARWLEHRGIDGYHLRAQHTMSWDRENGRQSRMDLVLADADTGEPVCVLDTKYKAPDKPSDEDIYQVVFYAHLLGCHEAALVYPVPLVSPINTWIGDIHVRTLTFALEGNLDEAGERFLAELGPSLAQL